MAVLSPVKVSDMVFAGEDKVLRWTIRDSTGALQDLTGWTLLWSLEPQQGASPVFTQAGVVTDASHGVCTVTLLAAQTASMAGGSYFHHLDRTDPGFASVLSAGTFALQAR